MEERKKKKYFTNIFQECRVTFSKLYNLHSINLPRLDQLGLSSILKLNNFESKLASDQQNREKNNIKQENRNTFLMRREELVSELM